MKFMSCSMLRMAWREQKGGIRGTVSFERAPLPWPFLKLPKFRNLRTLDLNQRTIKKKKKKPPNLKNHKIVEPSILGAMNFQEQDLRTLGTKLTQNLRKPGREVPTLRPHALGIVGSGAAPGDHPVQPLSPGQALWPMLADHTPTPSLRDALEVLVMTVWPGSSCQHLT